MTDNPEIGIPEKSWNGIYRISGIAAFIQIIASLFIMVITFTLGGEPDSAEECFALIRQNRLAGILRLDLASILIMVMYYLTLFGVYAGFRKDRKAYALLAVVLSFIGITLWLSSNSVFSMIYLNGRYIGASTEEVRAQLTAAGDAVIASNMWHSTAAVTAGYLLEGSALFLSILMLRSKSFGVAVAVIGIAVHGLDLLHIIVSPFLPGVSVVLMIISGTLYLPWFLLLGLRLLKLSGQHSMEPGSA